MIKTGGVVFGRSGERVQVATAVGVGVPARGALGGDEAEAAIIGGVAVAPLPQERCANVFFADQEGVAEVVEDVGETRVGRIADDGIRERIIGVVIGWPGRVGL